MTGVQTCALPIFGFGIVSQGRMADLNELVIMRQGVQRLAFGRGDFNFVAGAMIFGLSMVLFSMSTKNIWIQAALIFFCAYPVLSTMSRMGIIMYISTAFFWMVWLFKQRKISFHLPLVFMATIIAVIYINYEYFEAFRDALRYSALSGYESRSDTFGFLFYKILNNPLLGLQQDYGYKIYAHNAFLEFAMSVGLPGLFLICFWIFYPFLYVKTMYVKHSAWPYFVMTVLGMMMFSLSCSGFKTIFVFVGICYCSITEKDTRIRS